MRILVINLERSRDRRIHVAGQLNRLKIQYEFVDAIDGMTLPQGEIESVYGIKDFPPWPSFNARRLVEGEVGCLLSHLQLYRKMIDENIECACIFEDDNCFQPDMSALLKGDLLLRFNWDLLLIGHRGRDGSFSKGAACVKAAEHVLGRYHIAKPVEPPYGTHAYLIRRKAAEKLLQHAFPLRMPIDWLTGHSAAAGVRVRVLTPPCTIQQTGLFKTEIYKRHEDCMYLNKLRRLKMRAGNAFPILRTIKGFVCSACLTPVMALRKMGLFEDSYADRRLFAETVSEAPAVALRKTQRAALSDYEGI